MRQITSLILFLLLGILGGQLLADSGLLQIGTPVTGGMLLVVIVAILIVFRPRITTESYNQHAIALYHEIIQDVKAIQRLGVHVEQETLRSELELICSDTLVLLRKVAEKVPESRISTGKFIRGNLDFIMEDILPQYIEMQETPRYFDEPQQSLVDGQHAIETYAKFLHRQISNLEIGDEIRYAVAVEMLKSLETYNNTVSLVATPQAETA